MNYRNYRFFVTYCKTDEAIAKVVVGRLRKAKQYVKEMGQFKPGDRFAEEIRRWIDWCHFVVPIITEQSKQRPWVHQEIGYALGRHLTVLPIIVSCTPGSLAFLDTVQALVVSDESDLERKLKGIDWKERLHKMEDRSPFPVSACDADATFRSRLLANAAKMILTDFPKAHMLVRQCSRLTSFSLPRDHGTGPWQSVKRSDLFWLQVEEREALQSIADQGQSDLRIDPDYYEYSDGRSRLFQPISRNTLDSDRAGYDPKVQLARLETLADFLNTRKDENARVVVDDEFASSDSITIIGDYWLAFSAAVAPFVKFRKTIWTCHAPTIAWECEKFDKKFEADLKEQQSNIGGMSSRAFAIERINRAVTEIKREFKL